MSRRNRVLLISCLVLGVLWVLSGLVGKYAIFEVVALTDHAQHGSVAKYQNFEIKVPLLYSFSSDNTGISIEIGRGPLHRRLSGDVGFGYMTFGPRPLHPVTAESLNIMAEKLDLRLTGSRAVTMSSIAYQCYEYQRRNMPHAQLVDIWCVGNDPGAPLPRFMGSTAGAAEFYRLLESARPVSGS